MKGAFEKKIKFRHSHSELQLKNEIYKTDLVKDCINVDACYLLKVTAFTQEPESNSHKRFCSRNFACWSYNLDHGESKKDCLDYIIEVLKIGLFF